MTLYGFASAEERTLFLDLLKVDGVGPKGALKIMSSASSSRLTEILERGDVEMLEKIPGVGKKTAGKTPGPSFQRHQTGGVHGEDAGGIYDPLPANVPNPFRPH